MIKVTGLNELIAGLSKLSNNMDKDIVPDAMGEWIDGVWVPAAKATAPVASGTLRDSIKGEIQGTTAHLKAEADYASFVEEGTSDTAAQPFAQPAAEGNIGKLVNGIETKIRRVIK